MTKNKGVEPSSVLKTRLFLRVGTEVINFLSENLTYPLLNITKKDAFMENVFFCEQIIFG
jgi:hypothetical protein